MLEIEMVNQCYNYLINDCKYAKVAQEVPFLSRCIDIVLITKECETITIEFKIKNWRHAILQARNHMLGADRAYICLPIKKPSQELIDILKVERLGLYLYTPEKKTTMYEYLPAPINSRKVKVFNNMLVETMDDILKISTLA